MNSLKKILFTIVIVIGLTIIGAYTVVRLQRQKRQTFLTNLIVSLEKYKTANGTYPADLSKVAAPDDAGVYYLCDSLTKSFTLTYSSGIMNANTFRYNSQTKKWQEVFNY